VDPEGAVSSTLVRNGCRLSGVRALRGAFTIFYVDLKPTARAQSGMGAVPTVRPIGIISKSTRGGTARYARSSLEWAATGTTLSSASGIRAQFTGTIRRSMARRPNL
jgi:hypothetical protein